MQYGSTSESLKRVEDKLDRVLDQVSQISRLESERVHLSESLSRAFGRIDKQDAELEKIREMLNSAEKFISHTKGMGKMAWLIWSAMGISLSAVIVKVFGS
jgi:tRNA C32,U32 (ribose-2'-O)-methylase TrmJ